MKISLSKFYSIFAPQGDGFAECIVVISLTAMIVLAFRGKLTEAFAAALTAIGGLGVVHDNMTVWLANKIGRNNNGNDQHD